MYTDLRTHEDEVILIREMSAFPNGNGAIANSGATTSYMCYRRSYAIFSALRSLSGVLGKWTNELLTYPNSSAFNTNPTSA